MVVKKGDMVIPNNVDIVFEHYCEDCLKCETVIIDRTVTEDGKTVTMQRVTCDNLQICQEARTIAATEKTRDYPFI